MSDKKETVAIIGTNGIPAKYGGFETLAQHLTINLKADFNFVVYCSKTPKKDRLQYFNDAKLIYFPFKANGWQSIIYDTLTMIHAWFKYDKLLILGYSSAFIFPFKFLFGKKIVLNIGGIDWARDKWNYAVRMFIKISEKICVKFSDVIVTDNRHIQKLYKQIHKSDSVLIEYGGDHVKKISPKKEHLSKYPFLKGKYTASVSRAQSDNNLHMLLKAYESLPNDVLVLVSNWHISEYGQTLRKQYKDKFPNIFVVDAIYDQEELDIVRGNASLYIHSHSFCGTAPSLVEAMNLPLPIICYGAETNLETTEMKSYYFKNEEELIDLINGMTDEKLEELRAEMKEIAERRYTWPIIARKYGECLS